VEADTASRFAVLSGAHRVWAVGALHGEAGRLKALHAELSQRFEDGDRLVYLGNWIGHGGDVIEVQDEILRHRISVLARPGAESDHVAYLRGAQEEMWRKLLQLQFAPDPVDVLDWMLVHGLEATLRAYGQKVAEARSACRDGALSIAKWTTHVHGVVRAHPGHEELLSALRRAAFTLGGELLFVAAGIDPSRPVSQQSDTFWWGSSYYSRVEKPYEGYRRVVRGHDRHLTGVDLDSYAATLDGGCGRGGTLVAACFSLDGATADSFEV
jgi:serine/threonine protein phosphatase 1